MKTQHFLINIFIILIMQFWVVSPGNTTVMDNLTTEGSISSDKTLTLFGDPDCPFPSFCSEVVSTRYRHDCGIDDSTVTVLFRLELPCDSGKIYDAFCIDFHTGVTFDRVCRILQPFGDTPSDNSLVYILTQYDPRAAVDIPVEVSAIQGAIWHFSDGVTPCTPTPTVAGCGDACPRSWDIIADATGKIPPRCDRELTVELVPKTITVHYPSIVPITAYVYHGRPSVTLLENVIVTFETDFGLFVPSSTTTVDVPTNSIGEAQVDLQLDSYGTASVTARIQGYTAYKLVEYPDGSVSQQLGMFTDTCNMQDNGTYAFDDCPTGTPVPTYTFITCPTGTPPPTYTSFPSATPQLTYTPVAFAPTYTFFPTLTANPIHTPYPTYTPNPVNTPYPTYTPNPISTPYPTYTPLPVSTPYPTYTPLPPVTPFPTYTFFPSPTPTRSPGAWMSPTPFPAPPTHYPKFNTRTPTPTATSMKDPCKNCPPSATPSPTPTQFHIENPC